MRSTFGGADSNMAMDIAVDPVEILSQGCHGEYVIQMPLGRHGKIEGLRPLSRWM